MLGDKTKRPECIVAGGSEHFRRPLGLAFLYWFCTGYPYFCDFSAFHDLLESVSYRFYLGLGCSSPTAATKSKQLKVNS